VGVGWALLVLGRQAGMLAWEDGHGLAGAGGRGGGQAEPPSNRWRRRQTEPACGLPHSRAPLGNGHRPPRFLPCRVLWRWASASKKARRLQQKLELVSMVVLVPSPPSVRCAGFGSDPIGGSDNWKEGARSTAGQRPQQQASRHHACMSAKSHTGRIS